MVRKKPQSKEMRDRIRKNSKVNRNAKYEKLLSNFPDSKHKKEWKRKMELE